MKILSRTRSGYLNSVETDPDTNLMVGDPPVSVKNFCPVTVGCNGPSDYTDPGSDPWDQYWLASRYSFV